MAAMFDAVSHSAIFVLDQDEALDFYVGKLGLEVNTDVDTFELPVPVSRLTTTKDYLAVLDGLPTKFAPDAASAGVPATTAPCSRRRGGWRAPHPRG